MPTTLVYAQGAVMEVSLTFGFSSLAPGETKNGQITVSNTGDENLTGIDVYVSGDGSEWISSTTPLPIDEIVAGGSETVSFSLTVPQTAPPANYNPTMTVIANEVSPQDVTLSFLVPSVPKMEVSPLSFDLGTVEPDASSDEEIMTITNSGNVSLSNVHISAEGDGSEWISLSESDFSEMEVGGSRNVLFTVEVPEDAKAKNYSPEIIVTADGVPQKALTVNFFVKVILDVKPYDIICSLNEKDEGKSVKLTLKNISSSANIYEISFSSSGDISSLVTLPDSIGALSQGETMEVELTINPPTTRPIGLYDGEIEVHYETENVVSRRMRIKIPPDFKSSTFTDIDKLPASIVKNNLLEIKNLISDDPSHYYDIVKPFLSGAVEASNKISNKEDATAAIKALKDLGKKEERQNFKKIMQNVIHECEKGMGEVKKLAEETRSEAKEEMDWGKEWKSDAEEENFLIPKRDDFDEAKSHFDNAASKYREVGWPGDIKDAKSCENLANECKTKSDELTAKINEALSEANSEAESGLSDFNKAEKAFTLVESLNSYTSAKTNFENATERIKPLKNYSDLNKAIVGELLKGKWTYSKTPVAKCQDKVDKINKEIDQTRKEAEEEFEQGQSELKVAKGKYIWFLSRNGFKIAKEHFEEASNLYYSVGGDSDYENAGKCEQKIKEIRNAEIRDIGILCVIILIILIVLIIVAKRSLSMSSIRRDMKVERELFRR